MKKYFPMLREREEILAEIGKRENLRTEFESWKPEQREEFLDICSGVKGMKFLYDTGQRCACYSADLLLRQYRRVRGERKKTFGAVLPCV